MEADMEETEALGAPTHQRLRFVVLDCEILDGLDASAAKALTRLISDAGKQHVTPFSLVYFFPNR